MCPIEYTVGHDVGGTVVSILIRLQICVLLLSSRSGFVSRALQDAYVGHFG